MANQSSIIGAVQVLGVPDSACFDNFAELLRSLGTYLTVDIPNQNFSNVVISTAQPGQADRDKIWWRLSNSGAFVGIFFFSNSVWTQVFPPPNSIAWLYGNSDSPPAGYSFDAVAGLFTAPEYAQLIALAVPNGGTPPFVFYPAVYVGT